jgi:hypothetical protein
MLEAGVPFSVVAKIMGWSTATTVRMARRYGHISEAAQREAVQAMNGEIFSEGAQKVAQFLRLFLRPGNPRSSGFFLPGAGSGSYPTNRLSSPSGIRI